MRFLLVLLLAAACTPAPSGAGTGRPTPTAAATTASATPTVAATTAAPTPFPTVTGAAPTFMPGQPPVAGCTALQSGDQGVNRAPLTMRAAGQAGYDRVVIDFGLGGIPPFTVEQVPYVAQQGSGFKIEMQGSVFIEVHFLMAGGSNEYPGPRRLLPDTAVVREVVHDEFEGATTFGIGLTRLICPTLSIQSGGRLVLDFHYR